MLTQVLLVLVAAPEVLSFEQVLERVRANNASLLAARADVAVAEAEVDRAWVGWQPKLDAIGSVTFNSQEQVFDPNAFLPPGTMADLGEPSVIQPHVQYSAVAKLSQTLFQMSVLRAPFAAKAARRAAAARALATEDDLLFQAATMYATLGGLKAQEAAAERALAVAEQRVKDAQVQLEAGTATQLNFTRAETDRVVALGAKASFLAQRRGMAANLRAMIAGDQEIDIAGDRLPALAAKTGGVEERAIIVARSLEVEAAEKQIGLSSLNWLPYLNAEGQARWTNASGFASEDFNASATINLVIPIYDGGQRYADTHIAEARALAAKHRLEQEKRTAIAYLDDARAKLEAAQAELDQAEAQLKLANETVKQTEDLVAHGLATNLELTDADSRRFTADRAVAQKQLDFDLASLRVYYATGGKLLASASEE